MKIVIVGDGKVGFAVAEQLSRENHDIVVIDHNQELLEQLVDSLDVMAIHGNGASLRVQREADVGNSNLLIAVTSADEINLLCCITARKLGCKHTIARVRDPEYYEQLYLLREELGTSMTINPELFTAREIFRLIQFPNFLRRDSFAKGRVEMVELKVQEGSLLDGCPLFDLYRIAKVKVLVCAVQRDGHLHIPAGDFQLKAGDQIHVTASTTDLAALITNPGMKQHTIHNVIIIGGSRISHYLAHELKQSGIAVKIIEQDGARARLLAEKLPGVEVVHADGTDRKVLYAEGFEQADAVVTLTNMDEENLIISMYADYLHIPKVITKINRTEYNAVFRDKGVDCVVSPKLLSANEIVRYVRAMQNTAGGSVLTLHRIVDGMGRHWSFRQRSIHAAWV